MNPYSNQPHGQGQGQGQGHGLPPSVPPPRIPQHAHHSHQQQPQPQNHHQHHTHPGSGMLDTDFPQHQQAPLPSHYPTTATAFGNYPQALHGLPPYTSAPSASFASYPRQPPLPQSQPPQQQSQHSYHPSHDSPPTYTSRYGFPPQGHPSGQTGQGSSSSAPFINVQSPNPRRRESMPDMLPEGVQGGQAQGQAGSSRHNQNQGQMQSTQIGVPQTATPEPRMGQYMAYRNNANPYSWQQQQDQPHQTQQQEAQQQAAQLIANTTANASTGINSRRSTISRTTDDENMGTGPSGGNSEGSRPSSPFKGSSIPSQGPRLSAKLEQGEDDLEIDDEKMDHRKRKRNRTIRSCVPCHNHKRKCDRKRPCGRCTALGLTGTCVYEVDEVRDMNDPTVAETDRLRRRIAELEQVVRELRQKAPQRSAAAAINIPPQQVTQGPPSSGDQESDKGQDNKKRRVIVDRFARFKIDEAAMAAVASAAAGGSKDAKSLPIPGDPLEEGALDGEKGVKKDYKAEPYTTSLLPGEEMVYDRTGRKTFLGAAAGKSMLRRLQELTSTKGSTVGDQNLLSVPEDAAFTGVFPDTRKTFPFTTIWSHENFSGEIIGLLPNKEQSEVLLQSWKEEVAAFFLAWHLPTLEAEYRRFFAMSTAERMNVPLSSLSLFLMICSLGCVMRASFSEILGQGSKTKDSKDLTSSRLQSELYLSGAYQALRLCSFMSNPSIHTIQAQICINVYLLNSERAADAWAQTGSLVRQCIAMGLHVDPASLDSKISIRDAEVRRRIWWTVAGLDALFCLSFGRPSVINFYKTNLPQDRTDDNLSDAPGSAQVQLPPSNVISNETTDMTYHSAYFQLTIPTYELLDRLFHVDRKYSRSAIYGWFAPAPDSYTKKTGEEEEGYTYDGALRLARDIFQWHSHLPRGIRFDAEEDTVEVLQSQHSKTRINQILALCMKTFMIVMVLHRPYLRADPTAYPESAEVCWKAAHLILSAYTVGAYAKASIFWSWWTMSFRAFHAGAVCAFLAIREPGTDLAKKCMEDLRGAIHVLSDRSAGWPTAHPVQGDLCNGLVKLEKLATAATEQRVSPKGPNTGRDANRLSVHWTPNNGSSQNLPSSTLPFPNPSGIPILPTPLSQIRGFPDAVSPAPQSVSSGEMMRQPSPLMMPTPFQGTEVLSLVGDGFNGPESMALPHLWASMFGIKMEGDGQSQGNIANH